MGLKLDRRGFLVAAGASVATTSFSELPPAVPQQATGVAQTVKPELPNVKACVLDTFGTVVDWRSSVIAEAIGCHNLALAAGLLLLGIRGQGCRRWRWVSLGFLLAVLGSLAACGGGSGNSGPPPNPGTTPGTYTFTATGSFTANAATGTTQNTTVTVTIQ